jgi:transcriptional regulator with XRE-family HTH domain
MDQLEHQKAKEWRLAKGLTLDELAYLSGYSKQAIFWFEKGTAHRGTPLDPNAWARFKRICHSIELDSRMAKIDPWRFDNFKWG